MSPRASRPLELGNLRLIPARGPEHVARWYAWRQEEATRRFNPVDPLTQEQLAARMASESDDLSDETRTEFRWMVERDDGVLVGTVALKGVSWRMGYGELSYGLGAAFHGRGYGLVAARLLVDRVFGASRLRRVWASIAAGNTASRRIVERLGFTYEGTMREHFVIDGTPTDECLYGLLRAEWPSG